VGHSGKNHRWELVALGGSSQVGLVGGVPYIPPSLLLSPNVEVILKHPPLHD
jgi:hypothetical protein